MSSAEKAVKEINEAIKGLYIAKAAIEATIPAAAPKQTKAQKHREFLDELKRQRIKSLKIT